MRKELCHLATCLIIAVVSFSVCSCGDDDESIGSKEDLIGLWEGVTSDEWDIEDGVRNEVQDKDISDERYELNADMSFSFYYKSGGTWHVSDTGKWELGNNDIKLIYYYPNDGGYDYDDSDVFKILELSDATMVWEYHIKEPGLEVYAKQRLRKISN